MPPSPFALKVLCLYFGLRCFVRVLWQDSGLSLGDRSRIRLGTIDSIAQFQRKMRRVSWSTNLEESEDTTARMPRPALKSPKRNAGIREIPLATHTHTHTHPYTPPRPQVQAAPSSNHSPLSRIIPAMQELPPSPVQTHTRASTPRFYTWQLGRGSENYAAILERRRDMLRNADLSSNDVLRGEWMALIRELDSIVTEGSQRVGRNAKMAAYRRRSQSLPASSAQFGLPQRGGDCDEKDAGSKERVGYLDLATSAPPGTRHTSRLRAAVAEVTESTLRTIENAGKRLARTFSFSRKRTPEVTVSFGSRCMHVRLLLPATAMAMACARPSYFSPFC